MEDGPLHRARPRTVAERERLMVCDLRLRNHAWSDTTMGPCRTVHYEGMTDVHVTRVAGGTCARALERRRRERCRHVTVKRRAHHTAREYAGYPDEIP
jgi:hypothetical protein